jgi:hypothetical protein
LVNSECYKKGNAMQLCLLWVTTDEP